MTQSQIDLRMKPYIRHMVVPLNRCVMFGIGGCGEVCVWEVCERWVWAVGVGRWVWRGGCGEVGVCVVRGVWCGGCGEVGLGRWV